MSTAADPDQAYDVRELPLAGGEVATLVHAAAEHPTGRAVLYVHGFSDCFIQDHVAAHLTERGCDLWAVDLRHCGRSLRPGDLPHYVEDLATHHEELDAALAAAVAGGATDVVVLAHSTGGLICSLWLHDRRDDPAIAAVRGLALNSPWFELAGMTPRERRTATAAAAVLARVRPHRPMTKLAPAYGHSLHIDHHGEWRFDTSRKPLEGFPVLAGWLHAVRRGHARLHRGLRVPVPALLLRSDACLLAQRAWSPGLMRADAILDPEDMRRHAPDLGTRVTDVVLEGAMHDVLLSALPVRTRALTALDAFLDEVAA